MWRWTSAAILVAAFHISSADATVLYDPGGLSFESVGQSMWGPGQAFRKQESVFVGAQWSNRTATLGGISGSENTVIIPGTDPQYIPIYEPRIWVPDPTWTNPFAGYYTGCGCTKQVKIYPGTDAVTADTRSGVELKLHSSGKVGLEFGYGIDSGSVDARAAFGVMADLPDTVQASQYFSIATSSDFSAGKIVTQSPKLEAYVSGVVQFDGSLDAKACGLAFGCASGSTALPTVDVNQRIVSVDPGSVKILDGLGPGGDPIVEMPLLDQGLTLEGALTYVPPAEPLVGVKVTGPAGLTIFSSVPPDPSLTMDLAELTLNVPDIATTGTGGGTSVASSGRDDLLSAQLDLDGVATLLGGLPPTGMGTDLIDVPGFKVSAHFDFLDADAGPVLGVTQDFDFTPTLMTTIDFSNPVSIAGMPGLYTSWTGEWSALPDFAITQDTTFSPTFWLDTTFQNMTGLDLGLVGTMDFLKLSALATVGGLDIFSMAPLSLNDLLGLDNELFATDKLKFNVFDKTFDLGGFNSFKGPSFTLSVSGETTRITGGITNIAPDGSILPTAVPEPGILWLFGAGLLALWPYRRRRMLPGAA